MTANRRPELFRAMVMRSPFLEPLNTMLDPSQPLTAYEYEEWGNPIDSHDDFVNILGYDPYENIKAQVHVHSFQSCAVVLTVGFIGVD